MPTGYQIIEQFAPLSGGWIITNYPVFRAALQMPLSRGKQSLDSARDDLCRIPPLSGNCISALNIAEFAILQNLIAFLNHANRISNNRTVCPAERRLDNYKLSCVSSGITNAAQPGKQSLDSARDDLCRIPHPLSRG